MNELFIGSLFLGVLVAGIVFVLGIWFCARYLQRAGDTYYLVTIFWMLGALIIGSELLAIRIPAVTSAFNGTADGALAAQPTSASFWFTRLLSLAIVALAGLRIFQSFVERKVGPGNTTNRNPKSDPAITLFAPYALYACVASIFCSIAGTRPAFVHSMVYPILVLGSVYFLHAIDLRVVISHVKKILLIALVGSLLAMVVAPKFAFETGYAGLIPGLTIRLYGLASHPNSLGPIAVLYLALEYYQPSKKFRLAGIASALAVMLFAQSKTAYVAFAALIVIASYFFFLRPGGRGGASQYRNQFQALIGLACLSVGILGSIAFVLYLADIGPGDRIMSALGRRTSGDLSTFTGRTLIWDITLKVWRANPLFGYGPTIWNQEFRDFYGLSYVGQAHNQFIQTLGESGAIGLLGLCLYLLSLTRVALKTAFVTYGASLAILAIPILRTITEAPFRNVVVSDWALFTHLVVLLFLAALWRKQTT